MSKILFKGGEVVFSEGVQVMDVLIEGEKIVKIAEKIEDEQAEVIDCSEKVLMPGFIDAHVHFREPGHSYKEDWDTGSRAAVSGGVTTVLDMPNNNPPIFTAEDLDAKRKLIGGRTFVDYGLYMGCSGENIEEIKKVSNVPGVKIYVANSTGNLGVGIDAVREVCEKTDRLVVVHSEDEECIARHRKQVEKEYEGGDLPPEAHSKIRHPECALMVVKKVCELAEEFDNHLHIAHVSTAEEVEAVNQNREHGISCEVTPHHLLLSDKDYEHFGNFIRVNPPIRDGQNVFSLWKSLQNGEIDIVATDHAPHTIDEKEKVYDICPSGIPEVETTILVMLQAVNDDALTLEKVVEICCEKPADIFGIKNKGKIVEGYDADLVLVDMEKEQKLIRENLFTKCGWSPYEGQNFKGWPVKTYVRGQLVFDEGEIVGQPEGREADFS